MKFDELEDAELNRWVAKAEEITLDKQGIARRRKGIEIMYIHEATDALPYSPSACWAHGGPIIEREEISIQPYSGWLPEDNKKWKADKCMAPENMPETIKANYQKLGLDSNISWWATEGGPTPLIAAMRVYAISIYGEEVPDEG